MKRKIIAGVALLLVTNANTQITVNSTDIINIGDRSILAGSSYLGTNDPAGTNLTWDFSLADSAFGLDTSDFINPANAPQNANFPGANIASTSPSDGGAIFMNKNTSNISLIGTFTDQFVTGNARFSSYSPELVFFDFPIAFGDYNQSTSTQVSEGTGAEFGSPSVDSIKITTNYTRIQRVDSWGTVTLPIGSFQALRIKDTIIGITTSETKIMGTWTSTTVGPEESYGNVFVTNDASIPFYLVEQSLDSNGNVTSLSWEKNAQNGASISEQNNLSFDLFPNPSINTLTISGITTIDKVIVFDLLGKEVLSSKNTKQISIVNLKPGNYLIKVFSDGKIGLKKFIKN